MKQITLAESGSGEQISHILEEREYWAIKGAMAANRPLLVRGEPGIGKTQLAWAAAKMLHRPLVSMTLDYNTEARDLMWTFDAVQRLAEAQIASATTTNKEELRDLIQVSKFVRPGPVWWAFDWESAQKQLHGGELAPAIPATSKEDKTWQPGDGVVMLIDEIDKAESDVPNGLLESLGYRQFTPQGWNRPIRLSEGSEPPLIIVTTNEERILPDAFVRRCFVLHLSLPDVQTDERAFVDHLVQRGQAHFPDAASVKISLKSDRPGEQEPLALPEAAAKLLAVDRRAAIANQRTPLPGQAEYLDFLRAIMKLMAKGEDAQQVFEQLQAFVFVKSGGTLR